MDGGNAIDMDSRIVRSSDIVFNEMDGETIMMSIENGEYYGINSIGSRIWKLLETPRTVSDLCETLQPDFDVTPEQCARDVLFFLNRMAEKEVIRIIGE
jgi:hypothetical protein